MTADLMVGLFGGARCPAAGTLVDSIVVVSLAVFMAIDRDAILKLGLDLTPPDKRADVLMFRRSVGAAFAGFIRSQLVLGALFGVWAFLVSLLFGLPFAPAIAFLSGLIMAIPIYGPYVSWLPPVLVALLFQPGVVVVVALAMLVGWFIDENILAPLVRAGALQLHPIVITFAFLLGAQLAGAIGALIAIPLAAVVQAFVVKYLEQYRAARGWPGPDRDTRATSRSRRPMSRRPSRLPWRATSEPGVVPARGNVTERVLTRRALTRALLARQLLLERGRSRSRTPSSRSAGSRPSTRRPATSGCGPVWRASARRR